MQAEGYTWLCSNIIFPVHEAFKRHDTVILRKNMEVSQWLPVDQIQARQLERLRRFLNDVNINVPYYRRLFERLNFDVANFSSTDQLTQLPLLTKSDIRTHLDELKADDATGLARFNTGGSSGEPLIFYIGRRRVSHDVAAKWRATRWWGVDIGDPEAVIWGSPIELGAQDKVRLLRDKLLRTHLIPAFEMSAEKVDGFIRQLQQIRPKMLFGYPSALAHIASRAQQTGVRLDDLGVKVAFVTSERLYDHQREKIESVFACPVANGYGGRDAGFIAHQCPHGGMHITAEDIIVEIVDKDGKPLPNGELGEIVVTHLATRDFPFIRYRTGDMGILSEKICGCGRGLPLLEDIQGRTTDFVVALDGTVLHGLALIYVLRDLEGVEAFKITQESLEKTTVHIVKSASYREDAEQKIVAEFKKRLGQTVTINVEYTDYIPKERSGKFRYVISHVKL
ncbi:phenylacetate--CoA ligase family protein [Methylomonas koyamae]|uniref:Capsule biosynthesis protein CapK n=1 Tax=Methylomonas koyamae TaxID=702114 RepID=A0A291IM40_9GAMM|nr:AMP-binding protein [Methylomonas koyamae]ATG91230.1 capsule biosynthesis protein CapK [Methylomonas koyamae]OAI21429.1 capsule biosynthesis protein CapK [Methylomonas koyamae]